MPSSRSPIAFAKSRAPRFVIGCACLLALSAPVWAQLRFSVVEGATNMQISQRVLAEAYQQLGMGFEVDAYPGMRSLRNADQGLVDGELSRQGGLETTHPNLLRVPVPINQLEAVAFTRARDFRVRGWQSLKPYRVGIRRGVTFAEEGAKAAGIDVQTVDSVEQLFRLLLANRVDVIVVARMNGLEALQLLGNTDIHTLAPPVESFAMYHYLHTRHRALVPRLTAILQKMAKAGRIHRIREDFITQQFGAPNVRASP